MQTSTEKRKQSRIYGVFPVFLHIGENRVENNRVHTLAHNVSSGGLYLHLPYAVDTDSKLFILIGGLPSGTKLAAYGHVLRSEQKDTALFGIAIRILRNRLISGVAM